MTNPIKRKDIQRLAHQLVDGVDQLRRELAAAEAKIQQQTAEIERLRTENAAIRRQALKNMIEISETAGMYNHD